jgi:alanine racemase
MSTEVSSAGVLPARSPAAVGQQLGSPLAISAPAVPSPLSAACPSPSVPVTTIVRNGSAAAAEAVGPLLTVDLSAVASNSRLFADRAAGQLMAVVKADGFGHGAVAVAETAVANGASWLGVTCLDEAFALRAAGIRAPILSWLNTLAADFDEAVRQRVDVAIPTAAILEAVAASAARAGVRARVHLHVDVGMARDGAAPDTWPALCQAAQRVERSGMVRVAGVMGHLGWADSPTDPANATARATFTENVTIARRLGLRPSLRHLAATSATLTDPRSHFDLVRVGAGIVGIDPTATTRLRPAMTLTAPVVGVRDVVAGTGVGYGHTYVTRNRTRLALIPLGYADGIPRGSSGRAWVQLRGRRRPVVGVVCMDQIVVDVGSDPVEAGEVAIVFGPGALGEPTVADWAGWASTIEHEIVTGIGRRVARRLLAAAQTSVIDAAVVRPRRRSGRRLPALPRRDRPTR